MSFFSRLFKKNHHDLDSSSKADYEKFMEGLSQSDIDIFRELLKKAPKKQVGIFKGIYDEDQNEIKTIENDQINNNEETD